MAGAPVRVLVIDDSVVVRKILSQLIATDPELELAGTAPTAPIGIQKIDQVRPDVVVLDVEMPDMDGIEAAGRIRRSWPRLPILMCSTLTERGADVTLRALAAGASDYVAKPSSVARGEDAIESFRLELTSKLRGLTGRVREADRAPPRLAPLPAPEKRPGSEPPQVLLLGSSTGGPNALASVFAQLPSDLPVPILMVQHMPPLFTRMLADRLTATTRVTVSEAKEGDIVEPGRAYIAPGNFHMTVAREGLRMRLHLNQDAPENSCRPAVDVLFRSAARTYGAGCLAAVLTGMGHDGTRGARDIAAAGGFIAVQDAASCVVPSMPGSIANAGLANEIVTLDKMGAYLAGRALRGRLAGLARIA